MTAGDSAETHELDAIEVDAPAPRDKKNPLKAVGGAVLKGGKAVGGIFGDFIKFLERGNVVDLAVGIVMGAAFTAIVTSFVNDLVTPIIALALDSNFENSFVVIKCKKFGNGTLTDPTCDVGHQGNYTTVALAAAAGAVTWNWGKFIQAVINFLLTGLIVYLLVKVYANTFLKIKPPPPPEPTKECDYCLEKIKVKATKCKFCSSVVAVPEEVDAPESVGHNFLTASVDKLLHRKH